MTESIITSLITAASVILAQIIISYRSSKSEGVKQAVFKHDVSSRLENIEKKLDIHNHYADQISAINMTLNDLQNSINRLEEKYNEREEEKISVPVKRTRKTAKKAN